MKTCGSVDFLLLSSLPFLSSRPEPACLRQVPRALEFPAVFAGAGRSLTAVRQLEGSLFAGLEFASKDVNRAKTCLKIPPRKSNHRQAHNSMQPQRSRAFFINIRIAGRKRVTNHHSLLTVLNISNRHKHGLEIDVTP